MSRRGTRKRIARCVFESKTGRSGIYRDANGRQRELGFPPFTPVAEIRKALDDAKRKSRGSASAYPDGRGTLNAAIDAWATQEQHLASWKERRAELRAWAKLYGHVRIRALTPKDVREAMGQWTADGIAPKTIRNRLWSLRHLYRVLFGPDVETPVDHIEPPARVRHIINPTSTTTILTVYANLLRAEHEGTLRDGKTRARFMVRAASGRRPVEIMRAQPADVDLERRIWRVRDAKGGWSEGLYLHDDLLQAWQAFVAADAWGAFNTGSMARVLRACGWPEGVRPYNLRHSLGIGLSESGADFADVAAYLGHKDLRTTRQSYVPILNSRMERAGLLLSGRLSGWTVPAAVPASHDAARGKMMQPKDRASETPEREMRAKRQKR